MKLSDYEYKGLMAQAWDLLRGDTSGRPDRFFYLDVIERYGQPALDVGSGTGRLLLDYLALSCPLNQLRLSLHLMRRLNQHHAG